MASTCHGLFIATCLVFMFLTYYGDAAVSIGFFTNEDHPGKCYINEKMIIDDGDKAQDMEDCSVYHCNNGNNGLVEIHTCLSVAPPRPCKWTTSVDLKAIYPLCCLRNFHCDNPEDEENARVIQESLKKDYMKQIN